MKKVKTIRGYLKLLKEFEKHGISCLKGYQYLDQQTRVDLSEPSVATGNVINDEELFERIESQLKAKIIHEDFQL